MKVGALVPIGVGNGNPEFLTGLGQALETRGFESLWVPEHVVLFRAHEKSLYPYTPDGVVPLPPDSGLIDPFLALTYVAAGTSTLRLGTGLALAGQRNPVYTAKHVADLDVLSSGRVDFGVGLGWLREEYEAVGVPWARRGARVDDYLAAMKTLWTEDDSSYSGEFVSFEGALMFPKPVQAPHPPIHVGGDSEFAMRRAVAHAQGWFGMGWTPDTLADGLARLDTFLGEAGRSRDDVEISVSPLVPCDATMGRAFADLGVDRVIPPVFAPDIEGLKPLLDGVAAELIA